MIRKVMSSDREPVRAFFEWIIEETYVDEGVGHLKAEIKAEIKSKMEIFEDCINGKTELYILIEDEKIIGTAALIDCSELIVKFTPELESIKELSSVFIHKAFRGYGHASELIDVATSKCDKFCLDSGYTNAIKKWLKKFGTPYYVEKDYWGEGYDHYIWYIERSI